MHTFVLDTIPGIMDTGRKIPQKSLLLHFNVNKRNPYQGMSKGAKLHKLNPVLEQRVQEVELIVIRIMVV